MPKLVRLYIQQVLIGFFLAGVLVALLLWFNVANLWTLVSHSDIGLMAVGLLWLFNGIVFGAVYEGDEMAEGDVDHFRAVMDEAVNNQARIDQMTDRALVAKWPIARIDPTLRALFRAAGAEIVTAETPPRVVLTEYVDIATAFFPDGKEPKFVNAVLDHMAHEARPEGF